MTTNKRILAGALMLAPLFFAGCYPESPDSYDDYDLVYTDYSPTFDFGAARTYAIADSVVLLEGNIPEGEQPPTMDAIYGDQIIDRVRQNLDSRGWTEVGLAEGPKVVMLISAVKTENVDVYYYGGYWGWYYPYYGSGWYYPGYYPTYTSYTSGSLLMQMTDPNNISATNDVPVVWLGILNGVVEGSRSMVVARVQTSIDQAFSQTNVLKH